MIIDKPIENYQPYFYAFCIANRFGIGDDARYCDYAKWIENKHLQFRRDNGYKDMYLPLLKEHQDKFKTWLFEQAKAEGEYKNVNG